MQNDEVTVPSGNSRLLFSFPVQHSISRLAARELGRRGSFQGPLKTHASGLSS